MSPAAARVRRLRIMRRAGLKDAAFVYGLAAVGSDAERAAKAILLTAAQSYNRKSARALEDAARLMREERNEAIRLLRLASNAARGEKCGLRVVDEFLSKFPEGA